MKQMKDLTIKCKVCESPNRSAINEALLYKVPYTTIGRKYKIGYLTLKKHEKKHLTEEIATNIMKRSPAFKVPKRNIKKIIPSVRSVLGILEFLHNETIELYLEAKDEGKVGIRLAALKQIKDNADLIIRANDYIMDVTSQYGWESMIPKILESVKDYPDAKVAISMALRETKLTVDVDEMMKNG